MLTWNFLVNSPNINEYVLMLKKLSFISMIGKCFFHLKTKHLKNIELTKIIPLLFYQYGEHCEGDNSSVIFVFTPYPL